jgi:DNA-binding response OmpR family regulator
LIVSATPERQEMLVQAAADSGWETIVCGDPSSALATMNVMFVQLAVVDMEGQQPDTFRQLVEKLALTSRLLLIVCGNEGDLQEEIWVRQLGAWLYLPGVVDTSDLSLLCSEARHIAQRLHNLNAKADSNGHDPQSGAARHLPGKHSSK